MNVIPTRDSVTLFVMRLIVAILIFPHGAQKLFGWFGGVGFNQTIEMFIQDYGVLPLITVPLIIVESIGAILLLLGFLSRVWSIGIFGIMLLALFTSHNHVNFYLHYLGIETNGLVYQLIMVFLSLIITIFGGGKWSVDRMLMLRSGIKSPADG
ncbi:MAG: DoxX family protein [Candidatus Cyclobacteriaceae bacterium M3_2C_046]